MANQDNPVLIYLYDTAFTWEDCFAEHSERLGLRNFGWDGPSARAEFAWPGEAHPMFRLLEDLRDEHGNLLFSAGEGRPASFEDA